ncbi:molybdopterin-guanine dinucleotide biosynthesis protein B [Halanaerobaculum tunisiense]
MLSIVGWSNSGKTTFITKLIPRLKKKGYKVGTIKHNAHKFKIDKPGKDSWRHREAGAETVILSSHEKVAVIKEVNKEVPVKELADKYIDSSFDLVIVEGFKTGDLPKIEIFRPDLYDEYAVSKDEVLKRIINSEQEKTVDNIFNNKLDETVELIEREVLAAGKE